MGYIEDAPDQPLPREMAVTRARLIPRNRAGGRPSSLTDERAEKLLSLVSQGAFFEAACQAVGITTAALNDWQRRGLADLESGLDTRFSRFVTQLHRAKADHEISLARRVEAQTDEDWRAGAFVLERRYRERWGRHNDLQRAGMNVTLVLSEKDQEVVIELLKLANARSVEATATPAAPAPPENKRATPVPER